jgi:hypothetical protein
MEVPVDGLIYGWFLLIIMTLLKEIVEGDSSRKPQPKNEKDNSNEGDHD